MRLTRLFIDGGLTPGATLALPVGAAQHIARVLRLQPGDELRLFMWNYVGIVRTTKRLDRALRRIHLLRGEIDEYYANFRVTNDLIELRNLVLTADLIVRCAQRRRESRGLHASRDYPETLNTARNSLLRNRLN